MWRVLMLSWTLNNFPLWSILMWWNHAIVLDISLCIISFVSVSCNPKCHISQHSDMLCNNMRFYAFTYPPQNNKIWPTHYQSVPVWFLLPSHRDQVTVWHRHFYSTEQYFKIVKLNHLHSRSISFCDWDMNIFVWFFWAKTFLLGPYVLCSACPGTVMARMS